MTLRKLLLVFSVVLPLVLGADSYIKVTDTKNTKTLNKIKHKMKSMGLKPLHKTFKTHYSIYSGPYKDAENASYDMGKIKKYFPSAKIITTSTQQTKTTKQSEKATNHTKNIQNLHAGISVGYSTASSKTSGETVQIVTFPGTKGVTYFVNTGYTFENNIDISVAYMSVGTENLTYTNMYGSLNYKFRKFNDFTPYIGVLAGYSSLTWDISPTTSSDKPDSTSTIYGLQTGFAYSVSDSVALTFCYIGTMMDHKANILDSDGKIIASIEHPLMHSVITGVEFRF